MLKHRCILSLVVLLGCFVSLLEGYQSRPTPRHHTAFVNHDDVVVHVPRHPSSQYPDTTKTNTNMKTNQEVSPVRAAQNYKYDLGLGKNLPVGASNKSKQPCHVDNDAADAADMDVSMASRYWNEHLATRAYPSPLLVEDSAMVEAILPAATADLDGHKPQTTQQRQQTIGHMISSPHNNEQYRHHIQKMKRPRKERKQKKTGVIPKRRLEDVLFIRVDEEANVSSTPRDGTSISTSTETKKTAAAERAVGTTIPTIMWTNESQQFDVNSVWVEMLLHHQQHKAELCT